MSSEDWFLEPQDDDMAIKVAQKYWPVYTSPLWPSDMAVCLGCGRSEFSDSMSHRSFRALGVQFFYYFCTTYFRTATTCRDKAEFNKEEFSKAYTADKMLERMGVSSG